MSKLRFGTDGIRGVAGQGALSVESVLATGQAFGLWLKKASDEERPTVLVGRDTRVSGVVLEGALSAGLASVGVEVQLAGILPTPAVALLTKRGSISGGIVISASHNPWQDNGIKLFDGQGYKLSDEDEAVIDRLIDDAGSPNSTVLAGVTHLGDSAGEYFDAIVQAGSKADGDGLKVVLDCAQGAAYQLGPAILEALGHRVIPMGVSPTGTNINDGVGALYPQQLAQRVLAEGADLGVALDGDADRCILVDETGTVRDGDAILGMFAQWLQGRGELPHRQVVATSMSNLGLERYLDRLGIELLRTDVGDRHVLARMRRTGAVLGGEQSGHIIDLRHGTTGDGVLTAVTALRIMADEGRSLSVLAGGVTRYPQCLLNVRVHTRRPFSEMPQVQAELAASQELLNGRGRVVLRYSGTEALARVMVEAQDHHLVEMVSQRIAGAIAEEIGLEFG